MTEDINRPPQGPTVSGGGVTDPVGDPMPQTSEPIAATGSHDSGGASSDSRADTAKQEASKTAQNAQAQAAHVAETAADEAKQTVGEAKRQAMDLLRQTSTELNEQAGTQLERFTNGLQGFSSQARQMADGAEQDGTAATLVRWASETAGDAGRWLEGSRPFGRTGGGQALRPSSSGHVCARRRRVGPGGRKDRAQSQGCRAGRRRCSRGGH